MDETITIKLACKCGHTKTFTGQPEHVKQLLGRTRWQVGRTDPETGNAVDWCTMCGWHSSCLWLENYVAPDRESGEVDHSVAVLGRFNSEAESPEFLRCFCALDSNANVCEWYAYDGPAYEQGESIAAPDLWINLPLKRSS